MSFMVERDTRYIDPMFHIPEGIDEDIWTYKEDSYIGDADGGGDGDFSIVDEGDASDDDGLAAVENLVVVSQKLRRARAGNQVVDIVVRVDDIPGITKYEFRVTKI